MSEVPDKRIVDGIGVSERLVESLKRSPDGFETAYERLLDRAADFIERADDPVAFVRAFDQLPVSAQSKALEVATMNPGATIDQVIQKVRGRLTLTEAAAADRFSRAVKK